MRKHIGPTLKGISPPRENQIPCRLFLKKMASRHTGESQYIVEGDKLLSMPFFYIFIFLTKIIEGCSGTQPTRITSSVIYI